MKVESTRIPDVSIPVSRVGLGTWAMGGFQWGGSDDDESVRTIHVALERGINLIDTAPAYGFGHSEEVIGRAVAERGQRDRVVKDAGKIRAVGVSNYSIEAMERFRRVTPIASAQPPLNLFERDAEGDVIPWCRAHGVAALTYGALCRGLLSGAVGKGTQFFGDDLRNLDPKFQPPRFDQYLKAVELLERYAHERYRTGVLALAMRWVLDTPGVSVALWGPRHPSEVVPLEELMRFRVDDEARAYIDAVLAESVHDPVGPEFMAPPARPAEDASAPTATL